MPKHWKTYKLDELGQILNHKRIPLNSIERESRKGQYPYYGASGIVDYIDDFIFEDEHVLISEDGENLRSRQTPIAFKANGKFWVNNHAHIFKGREKWINDFIVYFFRNSDLGPYITGAVQPKLNKENLLRVPIKFQSEESAKQIASILSSLDNKIELNIQMNQTLEAMAQAIFKEWFVNFNFPGSDGKLVNGLPKGWRMGKLKDVCEIKYGKDHKHLGDGEIPVYGSGGIMRFADQPLYSRHSILIPRKGTLSNLFYVSRPFWSVDTIFYTIIKSEYLQKYLFYLLKTLNLASRNVGSAVPSLTTDVLNKIDIIIPDEKTLEAFEVLISSLYSKLEENNNQNHSLTQIRDNLQN
jgi:type I restriction enzyme S subunit